MESHLRIYSLQTEAMHKLKFVHSEIFNIKLTSLLGACQEPQRFLKESINTDNKHYFSFCCPYQ